jgi:hypothetical protein
MDWLNPLGSFSDPDVIGVALDVLGYLGFGSFGDSTSVPESES